MTREVEAFHAVRNAIIRYRASPDALAGVFAMHHADMAVLTEKTRAGLRSDRDRCVRAALARRAVAQARRAA